MSDEKREPTSAPKWDELVADASAIADEYRERGWDAVVLDPEAVDPVADDDRPGMHVTVSPDEYDLVESLVDSDDGRFGSANVYYLPAEGADRRFAIAVERDETNETAVIVPLTYSISAARSVLERALSEEELLVHVRAESAAERIVFSHEDPSLFLEESDVRAWSEE